MEKKKNFGKRIIEHQRYLSCNLNHDKMIFKEAPPRVRRKNTQKKLVMGKKLEENKFLPGRRKEYQTLELTEIAVAKTRITN